MMIVYWVEDHLPTRFVERLKEELSSEYELMCEEDQEGVIDFLVNKWVNVECDKAKERKAQKDQEAGGEFGEIEMWDIDEVERQAREELENDEDWVTRTSEFQQCELLNCLYELLEIKENPLWCDTYEYFNYPFADLILDVGGNLMEQDPFEENSNRNGITGRNAEGKLTVALNPDLCEVDEDTDILKRAKTLLHEGIHARLHQYVIENLPAGDSYGTTNQKTIDETFNKIFDLYCHEDDGLTDQHELMIDEFVDILAQALHALNDHIGEPEDYLYLAWLGLWKPDVPCIEQKLTEAEFAALRDNYEANIEPSNQLTTIMNDGCDF